MAGHDWHDSLTISEPVTLGLAVALIQSVCVVLCVAIAFWITECFAKWQRITEPFSQSVNLAAYARTYTHR
jgi:hypothetical protein